MYGISRGCFAPRPKEFRLGTLQGRSFQQTAKRLVGQQSSALYSFAINAIGKMQVSWMGLAAAQAAI